MIYSIHVLYLIQLNIINYLYQVNSTINTQFIVQIVYIVV